MDQNSPVTTDAFSKKLPHLIAALVFIAVAFGGGMYAGYEISNDTERSLSAAVFAGEEILPPEDVDFTPLWKVWHEIEERYVPASTSTLPSEEERVWGAIQGLTESLGDPYTVFLPPQDDTAFRQDISGEFGGVGMEIGKRDDILTVIAPLEGTPAFEAGIKSGDRIVRIDGVSTENMPIDEAVSRIRGEKGTDVELVVARDGELLTIPITRATIKIPTISTTHRNDGTFVIKLHNFSATAPNQFRQALQEFALARTDRLILDLRGNPGGYLEAAVDIASWFLPRGKTVAIEDFGEGKEPEVYRSKGYDVFTDDLKMVVLVDRGSASASEILAGALRDHGVATIIGETTFGKGSVQELVRVTDDTSLKVTIARWLTPNEISISENGLAPDVVVERTEEDIAAGRDPQLEKAVELLFE